MSLRFLFTQRAVLGQLANDGFLRERIMVENVLYFVLVCLDFLEQCGDIGQRPAGDLRKVEFGPRDRHVGVYILKSNIIDLVTEPDL